MKIKKEVVPPLLALAVAAGFLLGALLCGHPLDFGEALFTTIFIVVGTACLSKMRPDIFGR